MRQTIRHEGDNAKNLFRRMVTNVRRSNDFSAGDTEVNIDDIWYHVDVKECHSNTINQVRAIKYQTLVIYNDGIWYVIPPQEVVRLVAQKNHEGNICRFLLNARLYHLINYNPYTDVLILRLLRGSMLQLEWESKSSSMK
jgi:hypothetical protein